MQIDIGPSKKQLSSLSSESQPGLMMVIRMACEKDTEAIIDVETTSFPQVYTDVDQLADCRERELKGGYPCYKIIAAGSHLSGEETNIYGFVIFESYLLSYREYHDPQNGEIMMLPANRPENKPARSILMAAVRADPSLMDDEFLFITEICIHPDVRGRGNGAQLLNHVQEIAEALAVKIVVLVEGSVSDAAQRWAADETEEVDAIELRRLEETEKESTIPFYRDKLGFEERAYFFWGREDSTIPKLFYIMQY